MYVSDAANHGYSKVMIRTVDSDVLVLAIAAVNEAHIDELWVAFATGKSFRYLPAHEIALSLGPRKSNALLFSADVTQFHPLLVVERRQHGKFGRYMMKSLQHFLH